MNRMPGTSHAAVAPRQTTRSHGAQSVEASPPLDERSMRIVELLVAGVVLVAAGLLTLVR